MAALGKTPISLYYTPTPAATPLAANLILGEVALNIGDSNLYYLDSTATTVLKFSPDTAKGIAGGAALQIPYQTAINTTGFVAAPTVTGTVLEYNGTGLVWATPSGSVANALTINAGGAGGASPQTFDGSAPITISYNTVGAPSTTGTNASGSWGISVTGTAADIAGGANGDLLYQTGAGATSFLGIGTNAQVLTSNGTAPTWASYGTLTISTGLSGSSYTPATGTTIALANTAVTPGTYGTGISVPVITVDAQGRLTSVTTAPTNSPSYQGTWNAATNTPTIQSGIGSNQEYYVISVAGNTNIDGFSDWQVGDWIIFDGTVWQQVNASNTSSFASITVTGLTGYMYANATSQVTASTTIPNTAITGLGTMSTQNAGSVAITGGSIDGTTVGATTASTVRGSTITATTQFTGAGTGLTGTASSLSIGGNAATATKSTNIAAGSAGDLPYQSGADTTAFLNIGTAGQILTVNPGATAPQWSTLSGVSVTTFSGDTTGLTPATPTSGAITLGGILNAVNGGTGVANSFTLTITGANRTLDQSVASGAAPTFTGTNFSAIPNGALSNSSITFGATAQALGSTVSALNAVDIGTTTAGAGAFTTLSASSTVSGTGFSTYLASPPAIGGTAAAAGTFTDLAATTSLDLTVTGALAIATSNGTSGTMNNVIIGGSTPVAGYFTSLNATTGISGGTF